MGRLTKDAEIRTLNSGSSVVTMTLAVEDGWGDKKKTYFPRINFWGKGGPKLQPYLLKGTEIVVEGKLTTGSYVKQDGTKVFTTEISSMNIAMTKGTQNKSNILTGGGDKKLNNWTKDDKDTSFNNDTIPF